ncbi:MAG: hypothetical protein AAFS10_00280 [Myxococcota bacterium]
MSDNHTPSSSFSTPVPTPWTPGRIALMVLHGVIILNFLFEIIYAGSIVFMVLVPEDGGSGPLFMRAKTIPFELMVTRRLYAIEFWIATAGLAIYLAITEVAPRFWRLERR